MKNPQLPPLPPRTRSGRRPAAAFILATIARDIVADRKSAGLTQQQLAKHAGIRQETLSRIESGKHPPTLKTLKKIDRAGQRLSTRNRMRPLSDSADNSEVQFCLQFFR